MTTVGKLAGDSHEDEAVQITLYGAVVIKHQLAVRIRMHALLLCQSINNDYRLQMHNWMFSCWLLLLVIANLRKFSGGGRAEAGIGVGVGGGGHVRSYWEDPNIGFFIFYFLLTRLRP